jgi:C-terminal processing protease CtpA/Prc
MSYPSENVALMRIPVFMPQQSGLNYEDFLRSSFEDIAKKKVQHLIIDLRDNEGGMDSWGKLLYSYLTDKPFYYYDRLSVATDKDFSFRQHASLPEQFDQLRSLIKKQGSGYVFPQHENLGLQQPQANPYLGKLYILQNGRSFSVTAEFCAVVRDNKRGTFIGEESGGALGGNNSGAFAIVKLPNTQFTLGIPLLAYYMHLKTKESIDRGILPDHHIQPSVNDLLQKKDPVKDAALRLITSEKQ